MSRVRLRRRYNPTTREMEDVPLDAPSRHAEAPEIWDDLPGYESPVTGLWVEGRRQRREDLKRTRSRPYEGREQEAKEAARYQARTEQKLDQLADKMAHTAWAQAPERIRKVFRGK
jgi:hypothetical protein